jgi:hypothetical protein
MQMLAAGGRQALTEGRREANRDHPRAYVELEATTRLHQEQAWPADALRKTAKSSADPMAAAQQVDACLGGGVDLDAMAATLDRSLCRQRAGAAVA